MEIRTEVRPRRAARRQGWPSWVYYGLAGLLVLLTVPMYRYMLTDHSVPPVRSAQVALPAVSAVVVPVYPVLGNAHPVRSAPASAPERYPLADDQRCVGGAVIEVHGVEYRQIGTIQAPVHCAGRWADAPVR